MLIKFFNVDIDKVGNGKGGGKMIIDMGRPKGIVSHCSECMRMTNITLGIYITLPEYFPDNSVDFFFCSSCEEEFNLIYERVRNEKKDEA